MMQFTVQLSRTIAAALVVSLMGFQAADAQSLRNSSTPAEVPPTSFKGNQYIDSRGCVFVRAGINGGTNWVPRVTRDRKLVCGFQPTLTAEQRKSATQPRQFVKIMPAAEPVTTGSKSSPTVQVAAVQTAPKSPPVIVRAVRQPRTIAVKPYEPKADVMPKVVTSTRTKALPDRVVNRKPRRGDVVRESEVAGNVRVVPKHVYEMRSKTNFKLPKGYKSVWKDDRLNPKRAEQTFDGKAKMDAIWTQTVPRRLIIKPAG